jgi:adenylosuccinate lyase
MPHKQNPILSENICGLSRIVRSFVNPTLESVALWHERDMTHSSVERFSCVDATSTLGFMLDRMIHIIDNLVVSKENIDKNINKSNKIFLSQNLLLALIKKDFSREEAYKTVQKLAFSSKTYNKDFSILILQSPELLQNFTKQELIKIIIGVS